MKLFFRSSVLRPVPEPITHFPNKTKNELFSNMYGQIRQKSEDRLQTKRCLLSRSGVFLFLHLVSNSVIHESGTFQNSTSLHHYLQCLWQKTWTTTCLLHISLDKNYHISSHSQKHRLFFWSFEISFPGFTAVTLPDNRSDSPLRKKLIVKMI